MQLPNEGRRQNRQTLLFDAPLLFRLSLPLKIPVLHPSHEYMSKDKEGEDVFLLESNLHHSSFTFARISFSSDLFVSACVMSAQTRRVSKRLILRNPYSEHCVSNWELWAHEFFMVSWIRGWSAFSSLSSSCPSSSADHPWAGDSHSWSRQPEGEPVLTQD